MRRNKLLLGESPLDAGDAELLQYQVRELKISLLSPEEFQMLETEHRRLAHGNEIIAALQFARDSLTNRTDRYRGYCPYGHQPPAGNMPQSTRI